MNDMPALETARLQIRPFEIADLDAIHQLLDIELSEADFGSEGALTIEQRRQWLDWTVLNYTALATLYQPPYGDRAIVLKQTGQLIGAIGYVQSLAPFAQLPFFAVTADDTTRGLFTPEFGMYWALAPAHQRQGYTSEAARAMVDYAFTQLHLRRVIATTTYDNAASIGVMRKLGMRIEQNPQPEPPWFQVVGVLENR